MCGPVTVRLVDSLSAACTWCSKDSLNAFDPHEEVGTMIPIVQMGEPRP